MSDPTWDEAQECVDAESDAYRERSFEDLRAMAASLDGQDIVVERRVDGASLHLSVVVSHFGRTRKRVSVEIHALHPTGCVPGKKSAADWKCTPAQYWERFPDGRTVDGGEPEAHDRVAIVVLVALGTVGAGVILWRVFAG